jgi:hypothetical protein
MLTLSKLRAYSLVTAAVAVAVAVAWQQQMYAVL